MVGDTIRLVATAINAAGNPVADAVVTWAILDVDSGQVGFTIDSTSGLVQGVSEGGGRVQARVENLRSDPITVTVVPADSVPVVLSDDDVLQFGDRDRGGPS